MIALSAIPQGVGVVGAGPEYRQEGATFTLSECWATTTAPSLRPPVALAIEVVGKAGRRGSRAAGKAKSSEKETAI